MSLAVCTVSPPDIEQLQSSSYGDALFSSPAMEAAPIYASSANRAPPVATVMPLHSSYSLSSSPSVQPTAQRSEQQTSMNAEPSVGSGRVPVPSGGSTAYCPVTVHWFYCRNIELRQIWQPFSVMDSTNLELAHHSIVSGKSSSLLLFFIFYASANIIAKCIMCLGCSSVSVRPERCC